MVDQKTNKMFTSLVDKIEEFKRDGKQTHSLEQEIEDKLAGLYSLSANDIALLGASVNPSERVDERITERSALVSS